MIGVSLVCLVPQFLFEIFFARPFDVTAFPNSVDYEFTSEAYATEFAVMNMDAEWVKINGHLMPKHFESDEDDDIDETSDDDDVEV